jgi:hypothetical protein
MVMQRVVNGDCAHPSETFNTTNEDLLPLARAYIEAVAQPVSKHLSLGRSDELKDEEAVAAFFDLKKISGCNACGGQHYFQRSNLSSS